MIDRLNENDSLTLDWSPDSRMIAYTKQNQIILYDILSHQAQRILQPGVRDVQWFPSGVELCLLPMIHQRLINYIEFGEMDQAKYKITHKTAGPLNEVKLSPDGNFAL